MELSEKKSRKENLTNSQNHQIFEATERNEEQKTKITFFLKLKKDASARIVQKNPPKKIKEKIETSINKFSLKMAFRVMRNKRNSRWNQRLREIFEVRLLKQFAQ